MGKVHEKAFSGSSSESLHLVVAAEGRVPDTGISRGYRVPLVQRLPSGPPNPLANSIASFCGTSRRCSWPIW
jgi:hypothetical protein